MGAQELGRQGGGLPAPQRGEAAARGPMMEELAHKARKGSRKAMHELCREVAKGVLFRVMRYLPGCQDAEDVAQEALVRMCRGIGGLHDGAAFNGWLNGIILNEVRRYTKRNETRNGNLLYLDDYAGDIEEEDEALLPQAYYMRAEESGELMRIIDMLPKRQRQAVVMHYFDGLSVTETAAVMEVSQPNVSLYLKLAREKIREKLESRPRDTRMAALAALPTGPLIAEALRVGAGQLDVASGLWAKAAVGACAKVAAGVGPGVAVAAKAALLPKIAGGVAGVVMAGLVATATLAPKAPAPGTVENPLPLPPAAEPIVVYTGGDAAYEHLNPHTAAARTNNEQEFTPLGWVITPLHSDEALESGPGGTVSEPFASLPHGAYRLVFTLRDEAGRIYTLSRSFQLGYGPGI